MGGDLAGNQQHTTGAVTRDGQVHDLHGEVGEHCLEPSGKPAGEGVVGPVGESRSGRSTHHEDAEGAGGLLGQELALRVELGRPGGPVESKRGDAVDRRTVGTNSGLEQGHRGRESREGIVARRALTDSTEAKSDLGCRQHDQTEQHSEDDEAEQAERAPHSPVTSRALEPLRS